MDRSPTEVADEIAGALGYVRREWIGLPQRSWWSRFNRWLVPPTYYGDEPCDGPTGSVDFHTWLYQPMSPKMGLRIDTDIDIRLGWRDRIRILFSGRLKVWNVTRVERDPGQTESRSTLTTDY